MAPKEARDCFPRVVIKSKAIPFHAIAKRQVSVHRVEDNPCDSILRCGDSG